MPLRGGTNFPVKETFTKKPTKAMSMIFCKCYQNSVRQLLKQFSKLYQLLGSVTSSSMYVKGRIFRVFYKPFCIVQASSQNHFNCFLISCLLVELDIWYKFPWSYVEWFPRFLGEGGWYRTPDAICQNKESLVKKSRCNYC